MSFLLLVLSTKMLAIDLAALLSCCGYFSDVCDNCCAVFFFWISCLFWVMLTLQFVFCFVMQGCDYIMYVK